MNLHKDPKVALLPSLVFSNISITFHCMFQSTSVEKVMKIYVSKTYDKYCINYERTLRIRKNPL
jgi:hypothetical protein